MEVDVVRKVIHPVIVRTSGGLFDSIIGVTDDLLAKGDIATTRGRAAGSEKRYPAREKTEDIAANKPLDRRTASGAEIIAGALHDNARAMLVGTRSSGIGTSQTIYPLGGGDHGAIRLTTVRYFTLTRGNIQAKGVDPDIEAMQDEPEGTKARQPAKRDLPAIDPVRGLSKVNRRLQPHNDRALQRAFVELRTTKR